MIDPKFSMPCGTGRFKLSFNWPPLDGIRPVRPLLAIESPPRYIWSIRIYPLVAESWRTMTGRLSPLECCPPMRPKLCWPDLWFSNFVGDSGACIIMSMLSPRHSYGWYDGTRCKGLLLICWLLNWKLVGSWGGICMFKKLMFWSPPTR